MSFFFKTLPSSSNSEMIKPVEQVSSESGIINRRFAGVAYWRGSMDFPPHSDPHGQNVLLGELERAASPDGFFYAKLYAESQGPQAAPSWIRVVDAPSGFTNGVRSFSVPHYARDGDGNRILNPDGTTYRTTGAEDYNEGAIVSFRRVVIGTPTEQALGRTFVTARVVTRRDASPVNADGDPDLTDENVAYIFSLETPLPSEFAPEAAAVIEVCFNTPHVRAKMRADSIQWNTIPRFVQPTSVEWFEDAGGNLTFLHDVLRSPTGGPNPPPLRRFLISEDGRQYITGEDGTYITSEI